MIHNMIRYLFINNSVLQIYSQLPQIEYPLDVNQVIALLPKCRFMTYDKFAEINNCSVDDVIQICESKTGCTHYEIDNNRYLILCNNGSMSNNSGRKRWTEAHEVGHIMCKHFEISAYSSLSENGFLVNNPEFESEADYFAATLLAPFPLYKLLNIQSAIDVQDIFGLSTEASLYRFKEYLRWEKGHRKTSWENDIINLYKVKGNILL